MRHGLAVLVAIRLIAGWTAAFGAEPAQPAPDANPPPAKKEAKLPSLEDEYAQALAAGPAPVAPPPAPFWSGLGDTLQSHVGAVINFIGQYDHTRQHTTTTGHLDEFEVDIYGSLTPYINVFIVLSAGHRSHTEAEALTTHQRPGILRHSYELNDSYTLGFEEAYLTFTDLPWNLTARVGKFKAYFGWANTLHSHALPWPDFPLAMADFMGGDQLSGEGVELAWLAPWEHPYTELVYEVFRSDTDTIFATHRWIDPVHVLHLRNLFELAPASTFEVGLSGAIGPNNRPGDESDRATLEGLDLTYKWVSPERALYESFQWHTEFFASQKENPAGSHQNAAGAYTSPEYQFARQWSVGTRLDYSQIPDDHHQHEEGVSAFLTYRPVEKAYWRLQVTRQNRNFSPGPETVVMLQFNVTVGAHPAHRY